MKHRHRVVRVAKVAAVLAAHAFVGSGAFAPVPATAQQASAKGIYMSEASGGVKFNVLLERDGKEQLRQQRPPIPLR